MATFTPEEVKFLQEMGNGVSAQAHPFLVSHITSNFKNASDIWLATWTPSDYPEPDAGDKEKIKDFMHKKYIQKVWYRKPGEEVRKAPRSQVKLQNIRPSFTQLLRGGLMLLGLSHLKLFWAKTYLLYRSRITSMLMSRAATRRRRNLLK